MSKCIMNKNGYCTGYTINVCKGLEKCKFGKSVEQQKAIEESIVKHIIKDGGYLYNPLRSRVDRTVLLPAGEYMGLEA